MTMLEASSNDINIIYSTCCGGKASITKVQVIKEAKVQVLKEKYVRSPGRVCSLVPEVISNIKSQLYFNGLIGYAN